MSRRKKGGDGLRRMTYEECVSAGFHPAWEACVLGLHGSHPDAPADRPEPVAAFEVEAGGGRTAADGPHAPPGRGVRPAPAVRSRRPLVSALRCAPS